MAWTPWIPVTITAGRFTYNRPRPNDDIVPSAIANYLGKFISDESNSYWGKHYN